MLFDLYGTLVDGAGSATPGAMARIAECAGANWGIVTSAGTLLARALLIRARLPSPPVLVTGDDVAHNKPAPDGYLKAARRLGADPQSALALEDSPSGAAAARSAGMDLVALLYGRAAATFPAAICTARDLTQLRLRVTDCGISLMVRRL